MRKELRLEFYVKQPMAQSKIPAKRNNPERKR
jgi:hypothetical protein